MKSTENQTATIALTAITDSLTAYPATASGNRYQSYSEGIQFLVAASHENIHT